MTKRNYTQGTRSSRIAVPVRRGVGRRQRSAPHHLGQPLPKHYDALQAGESHPVDDLVSRIPQIAALDRRLLRESRRWQERVADKRAFISFMDARLTQRVLRQEAYFDVGFEHGRIEGIAASLNASIRSDAATRTLVRAVRTAAMSTDLDRSRIATVLLELARAFVLAGESRSYR